MPRLACAAVWPAIAIGAVLTTVSTARSTMVFPFLRSLADPSLGREGVLNAATAMQALAQAVEITLQFLVISAVGPIADAFG